ncbi:MAG: hypothetical protein JJT96_00430 [Opitutales bacterium]|nr:hypothetical protein [Opitutales bacterium]
MKIPKVELPVEKTTPISIFVKNLTITLEKNIARRSMRLRFLDYWGNRFLKCGVVEDWGLRLTISDGLRVFTWQQNAATPCLAESLKAAINVIQSSGSNSKEGLHSAALQAVIRQQ